MKKTSIIPINNKVFTKLDSIQKFTKDISGVSAMCCNHAFTHVAITHNLLIHFPQVLFFRKDYTWGFYFWKDDMTSTFIISYGYGDANCKDKLTSYNGQNLTDDGTHTFPLRQDSR